MKDRTVVQALIKVTGIVEKLNLAGVPLQVVNRIKADLEKKIQKAAFFGNIDGERLEKIFLDSKLPIMPDGEVADRSKVEKVFQHVLKEASQSVNAENAAMKKADGVYSAMQNRVAPDGHLVKIPGLAISKIDDIVETLRSKGTPDAILNTVKQNLLFQVRAKYAGWSFTTPKLRDVFQKLDPNVDFTHYGIPKIPADLVDLPALLKETAKSITDFKDSDTELDTVVGAPLMPMPFSEVVFIPSPAGGMGTVSYKRKPLPELEANLANILKDINRLKREIKAPYDNLEMILNRINERVQQVTKLKSEIATVKEQDVLWQKMQTLGWSSDKDFSWDNIDKIETLFTSDREGKEEALLSKEVVASVIRKGADKLSSLLDAEQITLSKDALFSLADVSSTVLELVQTLKKEGVSKKLIENILDSTSDCLGAGMSVSDVVKEFDTQLSGSAASALADALAGVGTAVSILGLVQGVLKTAKGGYQLAKDIAARGEVGERARIASVASDLLPMLADLMNAMPNKTSSIALKNALTGNWMFDAHLAFDQQREQFVKLYNANRTEYVKKALEGNLGLFELKMIQGVLANEAGFPMQKTIFEEAERAKLIEVDQVLERALTAHGPDLKAEYLRSIHALGATMQLATQGAETKSEATKQMLRSASLTALNAASVSLAIISAAGVTAPAVAAAGAVLAVKKAIETFTDDKAEKIAQIIEKMAPRDLKVFLDQIVAGGRETAGARFGLLSVRTVDELVAKRAEFMTTLDQKRSIDPPLPEFDNFDDRWMFIDGCIDTLERISKGVSDGTLDEDQVKPEREKIVRWLLAAQDLTSEKTFDQAAATHLRQPLCDAIAKAIDKMYGDNPTEQDQLIMEMLKRELGRINVVLPLGEGHEKMLSMTQQYAERLGVSRELQRVIKESDASIHTADLQALDEMKQFQEKALHPRAEGIVAPSDLGSAEVAASSHPEVSALTQAEAVSASKVVVDHAAPDPASIHASQAITGPDAGKGKSEEEAFLAYKKTFQELRDQSECHEDKDVEVGLSKKAPD